MIIEKQTDIILIQNILDGNKIDEKILYNRYKKIIKDYILSKYPTYNDIDDDVSEILIKIFLNLKNYDVNKSKFKSWVISITKNHLIDKWRCSSNITELSIDNSTFTSGINMTSVFNTLNTSATTPNYSQTASCNFENNSTITYISRQLSPSDFTLLDMKYIQGYNYDEIGKEFQITSTTVSNRINYIKTKLKKNISKDIYD